MSGIRAGPTSEVFPRHSFDCVHIRGAARAAAHYIQVVLSGRGLFFSVLLMTLSGPSGHSCTASCAITCSTGSQTQIHTTTLCKLTHSQRRVSPSSLIFMLQYIRNLILIALDTHSSSCSSSSSSSSWSLSSAHEFRMFVAKSAFVHFRFLYNEDHFFLV